ncbi:hypothetical protein [Pseudomonas sp. YL-218 TE3947]|uniref:hypothetical protein n=1 Tax=Pseudomonas TaxID=286 RepID=UPI003D1A0739
MSGKFWKITGALLLAVFTVALDKYWETAFVQGVIKYLSNIPAMLVAPVGVQLWLVIVAALVIAGVVLRAVVIATNQKLERVKVTPAEPLPFSISSRLAPESFRETTDEQKKVLAFLANADDVQESVSLKVIHASIGLDKLTVDHAVNQLFENDFVQIHRNYYLGNSVELTAKGKGYVVENAARYENGGWVFLEVK